MNHLERECREILEDNLSGSTELSIKVINFFERNSSADRESLIQLGRRIYTNFSGMGLVRNSVKEAIAALRNGLDLSELARSVKERISDQDERAILNLSSLFSEKVSLTTISRSSQVERALMRYSGSIKHVYVLESRPMLEGTGLQRNLIGHGIKATLLTDASMGLACRNSDAVLVGCDSLLSDYTLIHKMGTYPLFATMHLFSGKNYSIGIGMKKEPEFTFDDYPPFAGHGCGELGIDGKNCINQYFEMVPKSLIDEYCDENGVTAASNI